MASERELVQGVFETFNAKGGEAIVDYLREHDALSPDFGARVQRDAFNGGDWPGVEGFLKMVDTWMEVWEAFQVFPRELEHVGEGRWLAHVTQTATSRTVPDLEAAFFYTCLFEDGKLARLGIWNVEAQARAELDAG